MKKKIYLGMGSNLGDRMAYLKAARKALHPEVKPLRISSVYETPPWGPVEQDDFLNLVIEAETELEPRQLLGYLKDIELQLGRQPRQRFGPREIDIDILFYDELVIEQPGLRVPHSRLSERAFVLVPLAELVPDLVEPTSRRSIASLLENIDTSGIVRYPEDEPDQAAGD